MEETEKSDFARPPSQLSAFAALGCFGETGWFIETAFACDDLENGRLNGEPA